MYDKYESRHHGEKCVADVEASEHANGRDCWEVLEAGSEL